MKTDITRRQKILFVVSVVTIIAFLIYAFSPDGNSSENQEEAFEPRTTMEENLPTYSLLTAPSSSTTTPPVNTTPLTDSILDSLDKTGRLDVNYPELYWSPRYVAIVTGEVPYGDNIRSDQIYSRIPITELNKAENSNLSEKDFALLRDLAIDVAKSEATGNGTNKHPNYFTRDVYIDSCRDFKVIAAGAIRMPYPSNDNWVKSYVVWNANCYPFGQDKPAKNTDAKQAIYFKFENSKWVAYPQSAIPKG